MNAPPAHGAILVIDDEESIRATLGAILEDEGFRVMAVGSGEEGVEQAALHNPDAIFLDVWLPGIDGLETLRLLRERGVVAPVIMISGHGTIDTAVKATKLGAYDFVEKPLALERILLVVNNALRQARLERKNRALRTALRREAEYVGRSEAVERLRQALAAATDGEPVLLYGEKGTGRRLAARWLALHGPRPDGPFLDIAVSTLSRERLSRALFGDGQRRLDDPGRLALTDEGTLYLENADNLPATIQLVLIEGLASGRYPAPAGAPLDSRTHLIVALLEPPDRAVAQDFLSEEFVASFRHQIAIPPLRSRVEDIPELATRFVQEYCREYGREPLAIDAGAMKLLLEHDWPGNVRELQRVAERLVLLAAGPEVSASDLPLHLHGRTDLSADMQPTLRRYEESWLRRQLEEVDGDVQRAATRLGISVEELRERMRRLGL
jgi:two-component system nitrogen regulation response regulator NtrX